MRPNQFQPNHAATFAAAAGGGGGFTPASLPNLIGWYKADTGVTTSGGNITVVTDQSGTGHHLANDGTVPFTAASAYNSLPAFGFLAANDAALCSGTSTTGTVVLPDTTRLSVFFVGQMNVATATYGRPVALGAGVVADNNTTTNITFFRDNGTAAIGVGYNSAQFAVASVPTVTNVRVGWVIGASTVTSYVNGVAGTPEAFPGLALNSPTNIIVGNQWQGSAGPGAAQWGGPLLEVVIAASALSSGEVASLDAYFVARLGS